MSGGPDLPKCDMVLPPAERVEDGRGGGVRLGLLRPVEIMKSTRDGLLF